MAELYTLTKFTADVTEIVHNENDAVKIVAAIKPLMAKMIEVDNFLPEQYEACVRRAAFRLVPHSQSTSGCLHSDVGHLAAEWWHTGP